jgi:hypothetical protein
MSENIVVPVSAETAKNAWCDEAEYFRLYGQSIDDPEGFWAEQGKRIDWFTPYTEVKDVSFGPGDVHIKWFTDGTTNACHNCLDRHLESRGDQVAIIWEGDDPNDDKHITYREAHEPGQCHEGARRPEGRPGHHLHADGSRGGLCHAGLRAHRRDPLGGVRRLLAGLPRRADPRL